MIEQVVEGFFLILQWQNLLSIFIGVVIGVIIGMLPGLSPSMAVALASPITLFMPPIPGLSLLLGIYKGGVYGGSISAILIGTPGTPEAAATVFDGYPLTKEGKARIPLYATLYASLGGDIIGILVLVLLSPMVAKFALLIGPAETAPLILLALSIIIITSGTNKIKGFLAATLGFLLATVGIDPILSCSRLCFGSLELAEGITLIPLLIGLFAIPEIITQIVDRVEIRMETQGVDLKGGQKYTLREFATHWKTFLRSAFLGAFIGAMPGLGSATAAFTCYAAAQKSSKHPELYGKGSIEGLVACETGNNGTVGPALIPLVTLGIPGSATAAVLYGTLIINGIVPGPFIFRDHGTIMYAVFIGLVIGAVMLYPIAVTIFTYTTKAFYRIQKRYIFSAVFLLCVSGSYAIQNSMTDVYIMSIAGIGAYILKSFGFPMGPLLIAFILEPIFERAAREALVLSGNNLTEVVFESPISISLWLLLLAAALYVQGSKIIKRRKGKGERVK
jgi:putative tricarboxylic transport membrane protein